MFEGSDTPLPGPTRALIAISNSLQTHWYVYLGVVAALIAIILVFRQSPEGRRFFDTLKLKLPIFKPTNSKIITSRFTRTLSTLMASGIPLIRAMEVVSRVVNNVIVEERLIQGIENIRKGVPLSRAVKDVGIFPPMVDSMIKIGEESGSLDDMLYKTADFYDEEVEVALQKMTTMLEPIMIVFMAFIIGFLVIAMIMPVFEMSSTI